MGSSVSVAAPLYQFLSKKCEFDISNAWKIGTGSVNEKHEKKDRKCAIQQSTYGNPDILQSIGSQSGVREPPGVLEGVPGGPQLNDR